MGIGKTVIAGLILAVVAALTISFGEALGLDLERSALVGCRMRRCSRTGR